MLSSIHDVVFKRVAAVFDYHAILMHPFNPIKASKAHFFFPSCWRVTAGSDVSVLLKNTSAGQMLADGDRAGAM